MGRSLHDSDERFAAEIAFQASKLLRGDHDNLVTPVHGDVLGPLGPNAPHELAKARFGVLQQPASRPAVTRAPPRFGRSGSFGFH